MPKYAQFDWTVPDPSPVINWWDTDGITYPSLPDMRGMLQITDTEWNGRLANLNGWAVSSNALVPYTAPIPIAQQAAIMLAAKLTLGITIVSTGSPGVNGTYALDATSQSQIYQIGSFANSFAEFPSGNTSQQYPDISSAFHVFDVPTFVAFLRAVASLVSNLQTQASVMAQGGTPNWPSQNVTIA